MADSQESSKLTRQEISDAVTGLGWRHILGAVQARVRVGSLAQAVAAVERVAAVANGAAASVRADLRADQVIFTLQAPETNWVTPREIELASQISTAVVGLGLITDAAIGSESRSMQILEIAIDVLDIAAVRPFWKAVLGYGDDPGESGPPNGLIDPAGQGATIWFQQMDEPRPQRNRIHFDVSVPHDEAAGRIAATLAAGGTLLSDETAPAFWILADPEGNEACVCTWQARDR
ncbi:MAG TPA: VOC family protein [Streptosporangiaceae bacterium]